MFYITQINKLYTASIWLYILRYGKCCSISFLSIRIIKNLNEITSYYRVLCSTSQYFPNVTQLQCNKVQIPEPNSFSVGLEHDQLDGRTQTYAIILDRMLPPNEQSLHSKIQRIILICQHCSLIVI